MTKYFPALTGIRALAAWMVFVHHFIPFRASTDPFLHNLAYEFHTGVSIFFVLSGFLIYYRYQPETKELSWVGRYFRNRFARIFPLLFILTVVTYLVAGSGIEDGPGTAVAFLLNITLLNGYSDSLKFMGIAQAWTLTVEETFYLVAPLIMMIGSKGRLLLVPVVALAIGFVLVLISRDSQYFFGDARYMITYTFFGRCAEFCVGVFLAMMIKRDEGPRPSWFTYLGVALIVTMMFAMALIRGHNVEIVLNNFIFPLCVGVLFYGLLREATWISKLLSSKFFQVMGLSSYAFYLIHIGVIQRFLLEEVTGSPIILFVILNVIAVGLYYGIERPLRNLIK